MNPEEQKHLVGEIFNLTGQKVEVDDPIVVAALIHSQLIRRAGQDAMQSIQSAVDASIEQLAEAVKAERQAAADIGQATTNAYKQIVAAANAASEAELPRIKTQLLQITHDALQEVRKEAAQAAPYGWKVKVAISLAGIVLLGALAGGIIGATWFGHNKPTAEEEKQLAAGKDFLQVLPMLDKATKDRLIDLIQRSRQ